MHNVFVEIVLKNSSTISEKQVVGVCKTYLSQLNVIPGTKISTFLKGDNFILSVDVDHIIVDEYEASLQSQNKILKIDFFNENIQWFVYKLDKCGPQEDTCYDEAGDQVNLATHTVLPSADIFGIWENLIYDNNIKQNLLNYSFTMMEFIAKGVNSNIVSCNRVILLHGPPGTGKTSLSRAISQKLSIRMKKFYKHTVLVEVNSNSLFSKWFSESGKLVAKMFAKIKEIVESPDILVCLLIDEIESLAHARDQCLSGNDPSDSIKVVNAVLTQIDQIRRYKNVLIFTTSNMTAAIDLAFVDRADVKQYIGPPGVLAISKIYLSCIEELIRAEIISYKGEYKTDNEFNDKLMEVSKESLNMSGRMLRKIPFLAHALFLQNKVVNTNEFFEAMSKAVKYELAQRSHFVK